MKRNDPYDCRVCFVLGCDCDCKTCTEAQERNRTLSAAELFKLNMEAAKKADEDDQKIESS